MGKSIRFDGIHHRRHGNAGFETILSRIVLESSKADWPCFSLEAVAFFATLRMVRAMVDDSPMFRDPGVDIYVGRDFLGKSLIDGPADSVKG